MLQTLPLKNPRMWRAFEGINAGNLVFIEGSSGRKKTLVLAHVTSTESDPMAAYIFCRLDETKSSWKVEPVEMQMRIPQIPIGKAAEPCLGRLLRCKNTAAQIQPTLDRGPELSNVEMTALVSML